MWSTARKNPAPRPLGEQKKSDLAKTDASNVNLNFAFIFLFLDSSFRMTVFTTISDQNLIVTMEMMTKI
jgi:hypothetical protein